jgi:hypothetical protein
MGGEGKPAGWIRAGTAAPWPEQPILADVFKNDDFSHRLTRGRYQSKEGLETHSPMKKAEAGSDRKRHGAWDGGRLRTARVR